jgi:hypothetical protein
MNHPPKRDETDRFNAPLRHYHRAGGQSHRTWDEWVDGAPSGAGSGMKRWRIALIVLAVLALCAIVVGLIVELA